MISRVRHDGHLSMIAVVLALGHLGLPCLNGHGPRGRWRWRRAWRRRWDGRRPHGWHGRHGRAHGRYGLWPHGGLRLRHAAIGYGGFGGIGFFPGFYGYGLGYGYPYFGTVRLRRLRAGLRRLRRLRAGLRRLRRLRIGLRRLWGLRQSVLRRLRLSELWLWQWLRLRRSVSMAPYANPGCRSDVHLGLRRPDGERREHRDARPGTLPRHRRGPGRLPNGRHGMQVSNVYPGTPAQRAGLRVGDVDATRSTAISPSSGATSPGSSPTRRRTISSTSP